MLAGPLQNQFPFLRPGTDPWPLFGARKSKSFTTIISVAAAVVAVVILGAAYTRVRPVVNPSPNVSPQSGGRLRFAAKCQHGPVSNDFDFGGYLIYRGIKYVHRWPRTLFRSAKQFAVDYFAAQQIQNLAKLDEMADTLQGDRGPCRGPAQPMAYHFDHSPRWRQLYADDIAVVHVRR